MFFIKVCQTVHELWSSRFLKTMLSHYGRQKSGRQTHAKQNIFKICKLFKRLIDVIFDNDFTLHSIKTHLSKVVRGKNRFFHNWVI